MLKGMARVLYGQLHQGRPAYFKQDNTKLYTASITAAWLYGRRVGVLNFPACLQSTPVTSGNYLGIIK